MDGLPPQRLHLCQLLGRTSFLRSIHLQQLRTCLRWLLRLESPRLSGGLLPRRRLLVLLLQHGFTLTCHHLEQPCFRRARLTRKYRTGTLESQSPSASFFSPASTEQRNIGTLGPSSDQSSLPTPVPSSNLSPMVTSLVPTPLEQTSNTPQTHPTPSPVNPSTEPTLISVHSQGSLSLPSAGPSSIDAISANTRPGRSVSRNPSVAPAVAPIAIPPTLVRVPSTEPSRQVQTRHPAEGNVAATTSNPPALPLVSSSTTKPSHVGTSDPAFLRTDSGTTGTRAYSNSQSSQTSKASGAEPFSFGGANVPLRLLLLLWTTLLLS